MLWHFANPLDAGVLHFDLGIQAFGDDVADKRLALFFQQFDKGLLFGNQFVDAGGFAVEEF